MYVNPGNSGFAEIDEDNYVDKTGLIELVNRTIERKNELVCVSRPRRETRRDDRATARKRTTLSRHDPKKRSRRRRPNRKNSRRRDRASRYNSEESLRSVVKLAYYVYRDHYLKFEELPAGEGYADVVYVPLPNSNCPALVVELKWNQSVEGAVDQILQKKYPAALKNLERPILLVGVAYDKNVKKHVCKIVEYRVGKDVKMLNRESLPIPNKLLTILEGQNRILLSVKN